MRAKVSNVVVRQKSNLVHSAVDTLVVRGLRGRTLKVLVVEDKSEIAGCLAMVLGELGHEVVHATSVRKALETLGSSSFDAAVLDFELGGETSSAVVISLTRRGIPFIISSGRSAGDLPREFAGRPHLRKPYFLEELEEAVNSCRLRSDPSA